MLTYNNPIFLTNQNRNLRFKKTSISPLSKKITQTSKELKQLLLVHGWGTKTRVHLEEEAPKYEKMHLSF